MKHKEYNLKSQQKKCVLVGSVPCLQGVLNCPTSPLSLSLPNKAMCALFLSLSLSLSHTLPNKAMCVPACVFRPPPSNLLRFLFLSFSFVLVCLQPKTTTQVQQYAISAPCVNGVGFFPNAGLWVQGKHSATICTQ